MFLSSGRTCEDPGRPADGYQIVTSYEVGQLLHYECNRTGFTPVPPTPLICQKTGADSFTFNGTVPSCVGKYTGFSFNPSMLEVCTIRVVWHGPVLVYFI